jgi:hypothetical protein
MEPHVNAVSRSCFLHLRLISKARRYLTSTQTSLLVNALVLSRLDYCASLLLDLPLKLTTKLQRILNYSARLIQGGKKTRQQTSSFLKTTGWLCAAARPKLHILLLTFKALRFSAPTHLSNLLKSPPTISQQIRRSQSTNMLAVQRTKTKRGERAFSVAGPRLWNAIPSRLRSQDLLFDQFRGELLEHLLN